tara:strand:+ start:768 stop:1514 length:747 start_codon:yes stop_codon:yes gene_type:complete
MKTQKLTQTSIDKLSKTKRSQFISKLKPILDGFVNSDFEINKHEKRVKGEQGFINQLWQLTRTTVRINSLSQLNMVHDLICSIYGWTKNAEGKRNDNSKLKSAPKEVVQFFSNIRRAYKPQDQNGLVLPIRFEKVKDKKTKKEIYVLESATYDLFKNNLTYQDMLKALSESVENNKSLFFKNTKDKMKLLDKKVKKLEREDDHKALEKLSDNFDDFCRENNIRPPAIKVDKRASKVDVKKVRSTKICD